MILERTYTAICDWVGMRMLALGLQLTNFRVVCLYKTPDGEGIRAMHVAISEADLTSSMREFVDNLDASYEL